MYRQIQYKEKSSQHINSGANKVIVSAPCKGAKSIIYGVTKKFKVR